MSLERVISEQQTEIDRLKALLTSANRQNIALNQQMERRFRQLDELTGLRLRDCWRDDKQEQWEEYRAIVHEVKASMVEYGWCLHCQSFCCECENDYD